jgi:hypothetical protein
MQFIFESILSDVSKSLEFKLNWFSTILSKINGEKNQANFIKSLLDFLLSQAQVYLLLNQLTNLPGPHQFGIIIKTHRYFD